MLLCTRFALQSRFKSPRQATVAHAWRAVATADRRRHCIAAQREYRERAVAASWRWREMSMTRSRISALLLAVVAAMAPWCAASAQDHLKVAVGARGVGETFVAELGQDAGMFKKHGLTLDVLYTQGGGETQQVVIANSAQIGVAAGFLGTLGAYAKGAPIRVIGS